MATRKTGNTVSGVCWGEEPWGLNWWEDDFFIFFFWQCLGCFLTEVCMVNSVALWSKINSRAAIAKQVIFYECSFVFKVMEERKNAKYLFNKYRQIRTIELSPPFFLSGCYGIIFYINILIIITSQSPQSWLFSSCTDVVGCNKQVPVSQIPQLELPCTCPPAER